MKLTLIKLFMRDKFSLRVCRRDKWTIFSIEFFDSEASVMNSCFLWKNSTRFPFMKRLFSSQQFSRQKKRRKIVFAFNMRTTNGQSCSETSHLWRIFPWNEFEKCVFFHLQLFLLQLRENKLVEESTCKIID